MIMLTKQQTTNNNPLIRRVRRHAALATLFRSPVSIAHGHQRAPAPLIVGQINQQRAQPITPTAPAPFTDQVPLPETLETSGPLDNGLAASQPAAPVVPVAAQTAAFDAGVVQTLSILPQPREMRTLPVANTAQVPQQRDPLSVGAPVMVPAMPQVMTPRHSPQNESTTPLPMPVSSLVTTPSFQLTPPADATTVAPPPVPRPLSVARPGTTSSPVAPNVFSAIGAQPAPLQRQQVDTPPAAPAVMADTRLPSPTAASPTERTAAPTPVATGEDRGWNRLQNALQKYRTLEAADALPQRSAATTNPSPLMRRAMPPTVARYRDQPDRDQLDRGQPDRKIERTPPLDGATLPPIERSAPLETFESSAPLETIENTSNRQGAVATTDAQPTVAPPALAPTALVSTAPQSATQQQSVPVAATVQRSTTEIGENEPSAATVAALVGAVPAIRRAHATDRPVASTPAADQVPSPVVGEPLATTATEQGTPATDRVAVSAGTTAAPSTQIASQPTNTSQAPQPIETPAPLAATAAAATANLAPQPLPLQAVWSVQRTATASPDVAAGTHSETTGYVDSSVPFSSLPSLSNTVRRQLEQTQTAQPTEAKIDIITPRRPRPLPLPIPLAAAAAQPTVQRAVAAPTVEQTAPGEGVPSLVATAVGPLPADLWQLLGEPPPQAGTRQQATTSSLPMQRQLHETAAPAVRQTVAGEQQDTEQPAMQKSQVISAPLVVPAVQASTWPTVTPPALPYFDDTQRLPDDQQPLSQAIVAPPTAATQPVPVSAPGLEQAIEPPSQVPVQREMSGQPPTNQGQAAVETTPAPPAAAAPAAPTAAAGKKKRQRRSTSTP